VALSTATLEGRDPARARSAAAGQPATIVASHGSGNPPTAPGVPPLAGDEGIHLRVGRGAIPGPAEAASGVRQEQLAPARP